MLQHNGGRSVLLLVPAIRLRGHQGVIGALAGLASGVGFVSVRSEVSRRSVNPAEHVDEQICGLAGCLATIGSGGIAGGATGVDEGGNAGAQLASCSVSSNAVSTVLLRLFDCIIGSFRLRRRAALFQRVVLDYRRAAANA